MQNGNPKDATIHLKRAISVLPGDTPWWRSSMWRLGDALESDDKAAEALEVYIKAYKAAPPDMIRYSIVETLYKKVNGTTEGLNGKVGANPTPRPLLSYNRHRLRKPRLLNLRQLHSQRMTLRPLSLRPV
ncbi:MAG: hypothetical protein IPP63_07800 [Chloracidobacterium sp.]|nr:hypothetical protein [Chloracidobacterium sp.]